MVNKTNDKKRVLIVAADFKPRLGGIAEYAYHMGCAFKRLGAEVLVIAPHTSGAESFDKVSELQIKRTYPSERDRTLGVGSLIMSVASLASLAASMFKACSYFAPDVVYLPSMYPFAAFAPSSGTKIKIATTFHGGELEWHCRISRIAPIHRRILARSCRRSNLILANSDYTKKLLENLCIDTSKVLVTGCGVNWQRFNVPVDIQKTRTNLGVASRKVLLTLCRLDERKGLDTILRCMPNIRKRVPEVLYVIAGSGPMRPRIEMLVDELDLHNDVCLTGRISDEDVVNYMYACDVFAMPNRHTETGDVEGFGIVFLEANCCGKPVIAGRSGGAVEAVEHNRTGLLVDPYDDKAVEDAIVRLLTDTQLAAKLGLQGKKRVEEHFTWETVSGRTCQHILAQI